MLLKEVTLDDVANNPDAIIDAIAKALGEPSEEISIDDVEETDKGITLTFTYPDGKKPADFTNRVENELQKTPEFDDVDVLDPGILFFFPKTLRKYSCLNEFQIIYLHFTFFSDLHKNII